MRRWRSLRSNRSRFSPHLTLFPRAGRGDVPRETLARNGEVATDPFAPFTGRRCRQADEGRSWA
ncbi:hypothetical protein GFL95_00885 [Rhizobium leguminosarum bv. viciae]|nr:hypothetical protein [Rhizobium leguminosarum bv. viciae]